MVTYIDYELPSEKDLEASIDTSRTENMTSQARIKDEFWIDEACTHPTESHVLPPSYQHDINELLTRRAVPPPFSTSLPDRTDERIRVARKWIVVAGILLFVLLGAVAVLAVLLATGKQNSRTVVSSPLAGQGDNATTLLMTTTLSGAFNITPSNSTRTSSTTATTYASNSTTTTIKSELTTALSNSTIISISTTQIGLTTILSTATVTQIITSATPTSATSNLATVTTTTATATDTALALSVVDSASITSSSTTEAIASASDFTSSSTPSASCDPSTLHLAANYCLMVSNCNETVADIPANDCHQFCFPGMGLQLCNGNPTTQEKDCCNHCGCYH